MLDPARRDRRAGRAPAELARRHPGWAEADPAQWWDNVCALCRELPGRPGVAADVGVSGHGAGRRRCSTATGAPLRPAILQNDARAAARSTSCATALGAERACPHRRRASRSSRSARSCAGSRATSPRSGRRTRPRGSARTTGVACRLAGERRRRAQLGARERALRPRRRAACADDLLRRRRDRPLRCWPRSATAQTVVGERHGRRPPRRPGCAPGTPVVAGSADHVASAFAAGLADAGDLLVKLGGAGDILVVSATSLWSTPACTSTPTSCPALWLPNGCMAASGSLHPLVPARARRRCGARRARRRGRSGRRRCRRHRRSAVLPGREDAAQRPAGARARSSGCGSATTRGHLFRAVLEATAYGFRHHLEVFAELGRRPARVRVTNGGARSRLWKQVVADVLGQPLEAAGRGTRARRSAPRSRPARAWASSATGARSSGSCTSETPWSPTPPRGTCIGSSTPPTGRCIRRSTRFSRSPGHVDERRHRIVR